MKKMLIIAALFMASCKADKKDNIYYQWYEKERKENDSLRIEKDDLKDSIMILNFKIKIHQIFEKDSVY